MNRSACRGWTSAEPLARTSAPLSKRALRQLPKRVARCAILRARSCSSAAPREGLHSWHSGDNELASAAHHRNAYRHPPHMSPLLMSEEFDVDQTRPTSGTVQEGYGVCDDVSTSSLRHDLPLALKEKKVSGLGYFTQLWTSSNCFTPN